MPDKRTHRGPNPADAKLFAPKAVSRLRSAIADFSLLLTKGYAPKSSLKLVGDRFSLKQRQRLAIMRNSCSDQQLLNRQEKNFQLKEAAGQTVLIDGYNVLITIESAISGGVIFKGRDATFKDLASIHGTYRKVTETIPAIELVGRFLFEKNISDCRWLLDRPVSNSARLKMLIEKIAAENNWNWQVKLVRNPDTELTKTSHLIATSDSIVLDSCEKWVNLAADIIQQKLPKTWLIDLA